MRSLAATILCVGLCIVLAAGLGALYVVGALIAATLALTSGVYFALALAVGVVWPIVAIAFVTYLTRETSRNQAFEGARARARTGPGTPGEATVLPGVEDPHHRQN